MASIKTSRSARLRTACLGVLAAAALWLASGCGGGGASAPSVPAGQTVDRTTGTISVSLRWPAGGDQRLIPTAAAAVVVSITPDGATEPAATGVIARPATECTLGYVPLGQATLEAIAYPEADGTGTAQARGATSLTVVGGVNDKVALSLDSTIAEFRITPAASRIAEGETVTLRASATDSDGAVVLIPDPTPVVWEILDGQSYVSVASSRAVGEYQATVSGKSPGLSVVQATLEEAPGSTRAASANVKVKDPPADPSGGTSDVDPTVGQVVTDDWPQAFVLSLFRDQDGNPLTNLTDGNLTLYEDGQEAFVSEVKITGGSSGADSSTVLVLDRSGSMSYDMDALKEAANLFIDKLQSGDQGEVIDFDDLITVTQAFTSDKALLKAAVDSLYARALTALWDAMVQAINDAAQVGGRAAVVAMTDGEDNSSGSSAADVIALAQSKGIPVFTVGLGSYLTAAELQQVADQTGGVYHEAPTSAELQSIYEQISQQLAGQLEVWFTSPDPVKSGKTRHLRLEYTYGSFSGSAEKDYTY